MLHHVKYGRRRRFEDRSRSECGWCACRGRWQQQQLVALDNKQHHSQGRQDHRCGEKEGKKKRKERRKDRKKRSKRKEEGRAAKI
jgi:hypothetical protein